MELAPPPPGSRVEDLGERLTVRFRPRRMWGGIAFTSFWLALWTFGGVAVVAGISGEPWSGRAFMLVWLCGWACGECVGIVWIAWQLAGRESLTVTNESVEIRKAVGRWSRSKRYPRSQIHGVGFGEVPTDQDERPRTDFCLELWTSTKDGTVYVGAGMRDREADYVASIVRSRVRPRPRWSDDAARGLGRSVDTSSTGA
jgi:hypothetical protein